MAAARLLFGRDELKIAGAEVRKEGQLRSSPEDERDARDRGRGDGRALFFPRSKPPLPPQPTWRANSGWGPHRTTGKG